MKIILIVDNPNRDLPGLVLVANQLVKRDCQCYLVPSNLRDSEVFRLQPDFVLVNHIRKVNDGFIKDLIRLDIQVGVLDTEGGVFSPIKSTKRKKNEERSPKIADDDKYEEYFLSLTNNKEYINKVSAFFCWNEPFASWLVKKRIFREEQVTITGTPRSDFFHDDYKNIAQVINANEFFKNPPFILLNGSFALCNPKFNDPLTELEHLIKDSGYPPDYAQKLFNTQKKTIDRFFSLGMQLAKDFPETCFVYRPHPFENEEYYHNKFNEQLPDNLTINNSGAINSWLINCMLLVQWGSSTAIEGTVLGKPVYSAGWLPRGIDIPLLDGCSINCKDYSELKKNIEQDIKRGSSEIFQGSLVRDEIIEKLFYKVDGKSHERVVNGIIGCLKRNNETSSSVKEARAVLTNLIEKHRPGNKLNIFRKLLVQLSPKLFFIFDLIAARNEWDQSKKAFTLSELNRMIKIINPTDFNRINFRKVTNYSDYIIPNRFPRSFELVEQAQEEKI